MGAQEGRGLSAATRRRFHAIAGKSPGLELLVLFGSRGRGDAQPDSDWDFAFIGSKALDVGKLHADLAAALGTDRLDLVDLDRAGGLLRYRVARDGEPIYEARPRLFERFWLDAVSFWLDAQHVLLPAYQEILEGASR